MSTQEEILHRVDRDDEHDLRDRSMRVIETVDDEHTAQAYERLTRERQEELRNR